MSLKDNLTHKIGPLPAIAWAGIAGAIVVGIAYKRKSNTAAAQNSAAASVVPATPDVGSADDFSNGYGDAATASNGQPATSSTANVPTAAATNQDWFQRAFAYLVSTGTSSSDANTALDAYTSENGQVLNDSQFAAWQRVVTFMGLPPDGTLPTPTHVNAGDTTSSGDSTDYRDPASDPRNTDNGNHEPIPTPTPPAQTGPRE